MRNIRAMLPATVVDVAAEFGISVRLANSALQSLKQRGLARRTDKVDYHQKIRRAPAIWVRS